MNTLGKVLFTATAMITLFAATPCNRVTAKPAETTSANVVSAPEFSAMTVQGNQLSSRKLAGQGYIVNFFGSWCPFCRREIPEMVALQEKYEKMGFTFIGMAYKDNEKSMPDFIWEQSINYPVIMADKSILDSFGLHVKGGISSVPLLFAISRDGRLLAVERGAQTRADLEQVVLQTLQRPAKP